ncbi:FAD-binding protein, partial [bacterium]|nr:FAD-binding protein [bacterium]
MTKEAITIDGINVPLYATNTLIIGSGAAALKAALSLYQQGQRDIIIVTESWGSGTSNNAGSDKQTYYKLSLAGETPDSPHLMAQDLFNGKCTHGDIALCEAQHSAECFYHLVRLGVPFPHDKYGGYVGYKTDNDAMQRASSAGPWTSRMMVKALGDEVKLRDITVLEGHQVAELLAKTKGSQKEVCGALALNQETLEGPGRGFVVFNAVNVILATGGPAGMYKASVYPANQTGSTGLGLKIGAVAHNLTESQFGLASIKLRWNVSGSYQQVIPRYISTNSMGKDQREFLSDFFPNTK